MLTYQFVYYIAKYDDALRFYFYFYFQERSDILTTLLTSPVFHVQLLAARTGNGVELAKEKRQAFDFFLFFICENILFEAMIYLIMTFSPEI